MSTRDSHSASRAMPWIRGGDVATAMRSLMRVRGAIDRIDDALLLLLAGRLQLARRAGRYKRLAGLPLRDPAREARVQARAAVLAGRIGLPASVASGVIGWHDGRLCVLDAAPEASVRGSATDLLLLASRLEDADTLFFQRRLVLTTPNSD